MISAEYWTDTYGPYALGVSRAIDFIVISERRYLDTYVSYEMLKEWCLLSKKLLKSENRKTLMNRSRQVRARYFSFFRTFQKVPIARISNKEILQLLSKYIAILKDAAHYFAVSQPEGIDAVTNALQQTLTRKQLSHLMSVLITPTVPDIIFKEQVALQKLSRKRIITREALLSHAINHAWLFFNSYDVNANLKFLKMRFGEPVNTHARLREMVHLKQRQRVIFQGLKDKSIEDLCHFLQHLSVMRLELKDCWAGAEFRFLPLFQEIAKRIRFHLNPMMAAYTLQDYQKALLTGRRLSQEKVVQRQRSFILWKQGADVRLIEKPAQISQITQTVRGKIRTKKVTELHGVSANPGKVWGRARLVQSVDIRQLLKDLKRFKKDDILVTWMTQPNMVPIVRKAAAIIADEGGITSHAAVIAREFKIPCIVGTKTLTKVLKDGDMVEVDADHGVVRILK